ncbi:MAG: hypothetical protein AB1509_11410 [Chloroflexota bacterium]
MPNLESFKALSQPATASDLLSLFQSLLERREMTPQEALALAGAIHAGLRKPQGLNGAAYAQYARAMSLLKHHLPDVHQYIVANWRPPAIRPSAPKRTYTDSLFDDTAVMPVPGRKNA